MSDATGRNASSAAAVKRAARAEAQRRRRRNPEVRAAEAEAKRRRRDAVRAAEAEAYRRLSQEDPTFRAAEAQRRRRQNPEVTLCKFSVDQVHTLGHQKETGHVMVETSTQTAMAFQRTIPVQTRPTKLRSQGTCTGPE
nr:uncharacterized protein LOC126523573 [Dermacentor andersoni]